MPNGLCDDGGIIFCFQFDARGIGKLLDHHGSMIKNFKQILGYLEHGLLNAERVKTMACEQFFGYRCV